LAREPPLWRIENKDFDPKGYVLDMEIARTKADIVVSQRKCILYPLKETGLAFTL